MDIVQILGMALVATLLSVILKNYRPEFSVCVAVIFGAIFLLYICKSAESVFESLRSICSDVGIKTIYLEIMFKVIGVAYMCEFISSVCKDAGESAIASKVELGGKVIIMAMSIPIISSLLEMILKILP